MTLRAYVTFEDTQTPAEASRIAAGWPARPSREIDPDDQDPDVWDAIPPGRDIADELARGLQAGGLALAFPVTQWESYGWEFTVKADGRDVWFMLQDTGDWLLMSDTPRSFKEKIRGARFEEQHAKAVTLLASFLAPPRFTNVRWFTPDEFKRNEPGAESPT